MNFKMRFYKGLMCLAIASLQALGGFCQGPGQPGSTSANGVEHIALLSPDGTVQTWGRTEEGQMGDGTSGTPDKRLPQLVPNLSGVKMVRTGSQWTVALMCDGTVMVWGKCDGGLLGDGFTTQSLVPVQVPGITNAVYVATNELATVAVLANGDVLQWGLATGNFISGVGNLSNVESVEGGVKHFTALLKDHTVKCWGQNLFGELGAGPIPDSYFNAVETGLTNVKRISAGDYHSLAVLDNGRVKSWGSNTDGELGIGSFGGFRDTPQDVLVLTNAEGVGCSNGASIAFDKDGKTYYWGANNNGIFGVCGAANTSTPVQGTTIYGLRELVSAQYNFFAVLDDGNAKAWGANNSGQIGNNTSGVSICTPTKITLVKPVTSQLGAPCCTRRIYKHILGVSGAVTPINTPTTLDENVLIQGTVDFQGVTVTVKPGTNIYVLGDVKFPYQEPNYDVSSNSVRALSTDILLTNSIWNMQNAKITAACDMMWGGLKGDKQSTINISATAQDGSEVSDAIQGVVGLGKMNINNTKFWNNYRQSISIGSTTQAAVTGNISNNTIGCDVNTVKFPMSWPAKHTQNFYSWGGLHFGYGDQRGTTVTNNTISNALFGVAPFYELTQYTLYHNEFRNIKICGVFAWTADNLTVEDNDIYLETQPLQNGQTLTHEYSVYNYPQTMFGSIAYNTKGTFFKNRIHGTQVQSATWEQHGHFGSTAFGRLNYQENTTNNCRYGVSVINGHSYNDTREITKNTFSICKYGVFVDDTDNSFMPDATKITCNTFDNATSPIIPAYGIYVNGNGILGDQGYAFPGRGCGNKYDNLDIFPNREVVNKSPDPNSGFIYYASPGEGSIESEGYILIRGGGPSQCGSFGSNVVGPVEPVIAQVILAIQTLKNNLLSTTKQVEMVTTIVRYYRGQLCSSEYLNILNQMLPKNVFAYTLLAWPRINCQVENKQIQQALALLQEVRVKNLASIDIQRRADFYEVDLKLRGLSTAPGYVATQADISKLKSIANSNTSYSTTACLAILGIDPTQSDCFSSTATVQGRKGVVQEVTGLGASLVAFPNPFTDKTTIRYSLTDEYANAVLKITDLQGKVVKAVSLTELEGTVEISASDIPTGMYLYHIEATGMKTQSQKLIVIK